MKVFAEMNVHPSINRYKTLLSVIAVLSFFFTGCGGGADGPDVTLHPVSGVVRLNGSPLTNASVTFVPEEAGTAKLTYFGATDQEGKFVLKNRQGEAGCEAGKYKVVISKRTLSDGSPMPDEDSPEAAASAADSVETLPSKFSSRETTELMYEVPEGGKEFSIDLNE